MTTTIHAGAVRVIGILATVVLAGSLTACSSSSVQDAVTAVPHTPTVEPAVVDTGEPSLLDAQGTWCFGGDGTGCFEVDLPVIHWSSGDSYVWPAGRSLSEDPRTFTTADFAGEPNAGECFRAIDDFDVPPRLAATILYCPAGAVSGIEWVDHPGEYFTTDAQEGSGAEVKDFTDQDRLYKYIEETPLPALRSRH